MTAGVKPFADIYTGSSTATWTLPPVSTTAGQMRTIINRGTANLIVAAAGSDSVFTNQAGTQVFIPPNCHRLFINDGTYWLVLGAADGTLTGEQLVTNTSTRTLTSQTAAQPIFASPASIVLLPGSYFFESYLTLSSMSSSSGSFGFALGGTIAGQSWNSFGNKAALATAATPQATANTAANTAIVTANTNTVGWARIAGKLRIATAGAITPQVSLGVAAAAVVGADSYFRIWSAGLATTTTVGTWA